MFASTRSSTSTLVVCRSPRGACSPHLEQPDGLLELFGCERIRRRVLRQRHAGAGQLALTRAERVGHRQRVTDGENRLLRAFEQVAQGGRIARHDREPALTAVLGRGGGRRGGGPRAVVLEVAALVAADQRIVQPRVDLPQYVASAEGE